MMKRSWLLGLLLLGTGAAHAQVAAAIRRDSSVRFVFDKLSADRIRAMKVELERLIKDNEARQTVLLRDMRDTSKWRMTEEMQEQMTKTTFELERRRSELALACAFARPAMEIPGTLGIDTKNDSVMWFQRNDGNERTLTMSFGTTPPTITSVTPGSPAARAGALPGDVWLSFNGRSLAGNVRMDELMHPGAPALFRVRRNGSEIDLTPTNVARREVVDTPDYPADVCEPMRAMGGFVASPLLQSRAGVMVPTRPGTRPLPGGGGGGGTMTVIVTGKITLGGATFQPLDEDWKQMVGTQEGIGVHEVAKGTPAELWGLRKFDVIKELNGKPVTLLEFASAIRGTEALTLTVYRNGAGTRTVTVPAR